MRYDPSFHAWVYAFLLPEILIQIDDFLAALDSITQLGMQPLPMTVSLIWRKLTYCTGTGLIGFENCFWSRSSFPDDGIALTGDEKFAI